MAKLSLKNYRSIAFNNGSANDESGNGNNGIVNSATPIPDRKGNANCAYSFDGVNDYIRIASSNHPTGNVNITYCFWCKFIGTTNAGIGFETGETVTNKRSLFRIVPNYLQYAAHYNDYTSNKSFSFNTWYFVAVTKSGNNISFYFNGSLYNSGTILNGQNVTDTKITIGANNSVGTGSLFGAGEYNNGAIDDIRIYNRVLSTTEIQQLYNE